MALPVINQPIYKFHSYSLKKDIEFRPYTVGQEKKLLMISESKDAEFISRNIIEVLQECIITPNIKVSKMASYDIENLLIKIKAKSSGNVVEITATDSNKKAEKFRVDLDKVDVKFNEDHQYELEISNGISLLMSDLTFEQALKYQVGDKKESEIVYETIVDCVTGLKDEKEGKVYIVGEDTTRQEIEEFINSLSGFSSKLYRFLSTMPTVSYEIIFSSGEKQTIEGIKSFLA